MNIALLSSLAICYSSFLPAFPDCNNNGIDDAEDIATCNGDPACADCNDDGRPDECGVFVDCDIHETQRFTASDAAPHDDFGGAISASGDVVIVGAHKDDCMNGGDCGAAYVFRFDGTSLVELQKLTASDASAADEFGKSISVSGNVAVVGAPFKGCVEGVHCGAAYVFRFDGSSWIEEQKLIDSDDARHSFFGGSVAVSGNAIIVGAESTRTDSNNLIGAAYIFRFNGSAWVQEQRLTSADAKLFGVSVSIDVDTVAVGATGTNCDAGNNCGSAHVFRFDGISWIQEQSLVASDADAGDWLGEYIALNGDVVVVGTRFDSCPDGDRCGAAYAFRFDGVSWGDEQKLVSPDRRAGDNFGSALAVQGDTMLVGARLDDDCASGFECGSAFVFRFDGSSWIQEQLLTAAFAGSFAWFGVSVSLTQDRAFVGAWRDDRPSCLRCGAAYVFDITSADCDCGGIADSCELLAGASGDCNDNGIPDNCDIAECNGDPACEDCDLNEVPDGCQQDSDGDELIDACDACPDSQTDETITMGLCDTGVTNIIFNDGCTMAEVLAECETDRRNHGGFVTCINETARAWKDARIISGREFADIVSCAAKSDTGRARDLGQLRKTDTPRKE